MGYTGLFLYYFILFCIIFALVTVIVHNWTLPLIQSQSIVSRDKIRKVKIDNYKYIFVSWCGRSSREGHSDNAPGCTCGAGDLCSQRPSGVIRSRIWVLAVRPSGSCFCSVIDLLSLGNGKSLCDC